MKYKSHYQNSTILIMAVRKTKFLGVLNDYISHTRIVLHVGTNEKQSHQVFSGTQPL